MGHLLRKAGVAGQRAVCRLVLWCLYRALRVLARLDSRIAAEVATWPQGWVLGLEVPGGPALYLCRRGSGIARVPAGAAPGLLIRFKSPRDAFLVFTGQLGVAGAYAQHRFCLRGSVGGAMSFVRCVDLAEGYLFPGFWARHILKALPQKQVPTLRVYWAVLAGF